MFQKFNRFDPANPIRFHSPADDGGSSGGGGNNAGQNAGGGNDNPNNGGGPANDNSDDIPAKVKAAVAELLGKNGGDKDATLEYLTNRAHGLEKQRDEARQNALSKEDRELFDAFKALNLKPADVKRILGEHGTWAKEKADGAKIDGLKKAAGAAGADADLLASLAGALDVEYVTTGEGKSATATVKVQNGDKTESKEFWAWVKERYPSLEARLKAAPTRETGVTRYGKSAPLGGGNAPSIAEQIRKEEEDKKKRAGTTSSGGERKTLAERLGRTR